MNKKVLTLCAGFLLAGSVNAFAQISHVGLGANDEIQDGKYYALGVWGTSSIEGYVGVAQADNGTLQLKEIANTDLTSLAKVDSALWKISVSTTADGGFVRFAMTNKATGVTFSFDEDNAVVGSASVTDASKVVGGVLTQWKWYDSRFGNDISSAKPLSMDFANGDSTLTVAKDANNILYAVKDHKSKTISGALQIRVLNAGNWVMSAADLNTKGDDVKYMQLAFNEDIANNPFADKYQAQTLVASNPTKAYQIQRNHKDGFTNGKTEYVVLNKLNEKNELSYNYLRLDTAYYESTGSSYKLYNKLATSAAILEKDAEANNYSVIDTLGYNLPDDAFRFKFTKNLLTDSIEVESFSQFVELENGVTPKNRKGNAVTYWTMLNDDAAVGTISSNVASDAADDVNNNTGVLNTVLSHCTLVDENMNVVTFYSDDATRTNNLVNLWASAGIDSDITSVEDNLYLIQDVNTNEYYGVQIYSTDSIARYWTIDKDEMNLDHIPAFQWVVIKADHSAARRDVSPVAISNREFSGLTGAYSHNIIGYQLRKGTKDGQYMFNGHEVRFVPVSDESRTSEVVGYKELDPQDLDVNRYTFNYMHSYTLDKYIALHENDSLMDVLGETPTRFTIKTTNDEAVEYGYDVEDAEGSEIDDLGQLTRRAYTIHVGDKNAYINKEGQLVMTDDASSEDKPTLFYFKENNQIVNNENDVCYYALINIQGDHVKAGVVDNDLKALVRTQVMGETRTSVFAINADESPLYRRFNNVELEGNEGDASDTLRFVEQYRGEMLQIEGNTNFKVSGIDFLGIDDATNAPSGLAFIVDTAWVNRGLGYIKPQYLISIERDDVAATPGVPCDATNHQHMDAEGNPTDAAHCFHATPATPAINFGKYLVNFEDSTNADVTTGADKYKWAGYTRAGFVKAINYSDSLYILKGQFADVTKADVNEALLEEIVTADSIAKANGKVGYIVNLTGDNHKYVTWSMRYVKPGDASDKTFLIESMKAAGDADIAPAKAAWLKMQNGCLVLSDPTESEFSNAQTGGDDALIFDVEYVANDEIATENESIVAGEVSVVATDGAVIVKGAEGKNVIVSTILGKVVANEVLNSDNETIAAPAGIVVVSVDGESFKVAVK